MLYFLLLIHAHEEPPHHRCLLTNFFSNLDFSAPRAIITDASDHFGISKRLEVCIPPNPAPIIPKGPMPVVSQSNPQKFKQANAVVDWKNLADLVDDMKMSFQRFYDRLILIMSKTCIIVRLHQEKKMLISWLSPSLLSCIKQFVVTNCSEEQPGSIVTETLKNRILSTIVTSKESHFYAGFKYISSIKLSLESHKIKILR